MREPQNFVAALFRVGVRSNARERDPADEDVDETERDIDLLINQVHVTRGQAIAALKNNDGDVVNAIMELTDM